MFVPIQRSTTNLSRYLSRYPARRGSTVRSIKSDQVQNPDLTFGRSGYLGRGVEDHDARSGAAIDIIRASNWENESFGIWNGTGGSVAENLLSLAVEFRSGRTCYAKVEALPPRWLPTATMIRASTLNF